MNKTLKVSVSVEDQGSAQRHQDLGTGVIVDVCIQQADNEQSWRDLEQHPRSFNWGLWILDHLFEIISLLSNFGRQ